MQNIHYVHYITSRKMYCFGYNVKIEICCTSACFGASPHPQCHDLKKFSVTRKIKIYTTRL